jgi:hypothetical protein
MSDRPTILFLLLASIMMAACTYEAFKAWKKEGLAQSPKFRYTVKINGNN